MSDYKSTIYEAFFVGAINGIVTNKSERTNAHRVCRRFISRVFIIHPDFFLESTRDMYNLHLTLITLPSFVFVVVPVSLH